MKYYLLYVHLKRSVVKYFNIKLFKYMYFKRYTSNTLVLKYYNYNSSILSATTTVEHFDFSNEFQK